MKLRQVNYTEHEGIKDVTVTLTFNEALAIVNIAGKLNGIAQRKLNLGDSDSLYETLSGVFNTQFEEGYPELGIDLKTLNESE